MIKNMLGAEAHENEVFSIAGVSLSGKTDGQPSLTLKTEEQIQQEEQMKQVIQAIDDYKPFFEIFFIVLLVVAFLSIVTSSMLIHGIRKARRGLLVPWCCQEVVHILLTLVIIVFDFVILGVTKAAWMSVIPSFVILILQFFFFLVVVSQFQALGLIRMHDEMCMK